MQYMKLDDSQRQAMLDALRHMSSYLAAEFADLSSEQALIPGPEGTFSPVEQIWHLADLEREGFGARISRLRLESNPQLPDFDGTAIAEARNYRSRSITEGLAAFARAREANLASLQTIAAGEWPAAGTLEGVGPVSLGDIPGFMSQHDAAHRAEIEAWRHSLSCGTPLPT